MKPSQMREHAAQMRHIVNQKIIECMRQSERRDDGRDYDAIVDRLYAWRNECARLSTWR